jgi:hypothetical protein
VRDEVMFHNIFMESLDLDETIEFSRKAAKTQIKAEKPLRLCER